MKSMALDCYYEGCRDHGVVKAWPQEQILGYVDYQFEGTFALRVEQLMWLVVLYVLAGGWAPEWSLKARKAIAEQIADPGLEGLLEDVPKDEADSFKHDLRILKLI